jgi:DNA-binding NarL/FixJ family response regulator
MISPRTRAELKGRRSVLLVDGHPVVREGLRVLINQQPDMVVCGEAATVAGALRAIAAHKPDVVITELELPDSNGLDLIKDIRARYPRLPVLVFTARDEGVYAGRALRAGARGCIAKETSAENILRAIRALLGGQMAVSEKIGARLLIEYASHGTPAGSDGVQRLSDRELEVFQLIGRGLGTRQIADRLHLSVKTIEKYREGIKEKLCLRTAPELHYHAFHWANTPPVSESGPDI